MFRVGFLVDEFRGGNFGAEVCFLTVQGCVYDLVFGKHVWGVGLWCLVLLVEITWCLGLI